MPHKNNRYGVELEVIVADCDANIQVSLDYFFSVICEKNTWITSCFRNAESALVKSSALKVLVIGESDIQKDKRGLVRKAVNLKSPPHIFVIDHRSHAQNRIDAYRAGAHDVIRTPFSLIEFGHRLNLHLEGSFSEKISTLPASEIEWETEAFIADFANLTAAESKIFHVLAENHGNIVTRDQLSIATTGMPWKFGDRKFDVHLSNLRKKLLKRFGEKCRVQTVHSTGYILNLGTSLIPNEKHAVSALTSDLLLP